MRTLATTRTDGNSLQLAESTDAGGTQVFYLNGHLDARTAGPVWSAALRNLPAAGKPLAVDASDLRYCDGTGMTMLLDLEGEQCRRGGTFELRHLADELQLLLQTFRFEQNVDDAAVVPARASLLELIGAGAATLWRDLGELLTWLGVVSEALLRAALQPHKVRWHDVFAIANRAGAFALPVIVLIGFILGWILAFQAAHIMRQYGADTFMAAMIGPAMIRELGPLMTTIILAARSGSAFAAEIGTMKVNEEVDALTTMGLQPSDFLITPRILAAVMVTPLLTAFAALAGIVGGALVSSLLLDVPLVVYRNQLQQVVSLGDMWSGGLKAMVFGIEVAAIGCIRGLQTRGGASAVGIQTTSAVVSGIVLIAITDGLLAVLFQRLGI